MENSLEKAQQFQKQFNQLMFKYDDLCLNTMLEACLTSWMDICKEINEEIEDPLFYAYGRACLAVNNVYLYLYSQENPESLTENAP